MSPGISFLKKPTGLFMMSGWLLERSHTQLLVMYVLHQSFKLYSGSKRHGVLYMKICCIKKGGIARDAKTFIEDETSKLLQPEVEDESDPFADLELEDEEE
uniref:Uncharacterized protein n=1 Tax=Amphimedon queenslandica TaxID=400682 RepID=A0A1X7SGA4_AMPQE